MLFLLNDDMLIVLFLRIKFIKDKNNFLQINKYNYRLLKERINKYRLIYYLHNDYLNFYNLLQTEDYSKDKYFIDTVISRAFMRVPILEVSKVCSMYDLRFVFELMYNGYGLDAKEIKLISLPRFYVHFYNVIFNCLSTSREETLKNISKSKFLFSLQQQPKFCESIRSKKNFRWDSIIK